MISFFGAVKIGAVQVPVNTAYKGEFLRHQLADSGAAVMIVQGDFAGRIADLDLSTLPELTAVVVVGAPDRDVDGDRRARLGRRDRPAAPTIRCPTRG